MSATIAAPAAGFVDTSFKTQADNAISVVLREIQHSCDLHEVRVCINAIMAIRDLQYRQEADEKRPGLGGAGAGPFAVRPIWRGSINQSVPGMSIEEMEALHNQREAEDTARQAYYGGFLG